MRDKHLSVKVSEAERQLLKGVAKAQHVTLSEVIRRGAMAEVERWLDAQRGENGEKGKD